MPIRHFKCQVCGYERDSFKPSPKCNHNQEEEGSPLPLAAMEEVITAPSAKLLEPRDSVAKEMGKSVMKDQNKILKARSRNHARDNEISELVATNDKNIAKANRWINEKGQVRKKIDDL